MIYDQANTPSLSQWLGASLYLLAHLPHWVALFHASGGSNLRSSGSIYPQYSGIPYTNPTSCLASVKTS